ncbi:MAG: helix-turn-helix domain-containing protein, partial [Bifidobacterium sp.]|nr:helix-turn-helix domain-containing protein [Bifidobacterium sp.]
GYAACAADAEPKGLRGRIRERTDQKILRAVLDIIATKGVGGLTMEAVSRASGVAKTTLYRRYANADDLMRHLATMIGPPIDFAATPLDRAHLRDLFERMQSTFDERYGLRAIGIVLSSGNPRVMEIAHQVVDPAERRFCDYLAEGAARGVCRADADGHFIFQTALGSMIACKALEGDVAGWAAHMATMTAPLIFG